MSPGLVTQATDFLILLKNKVLKKTSSRFKKNMFKFETINNKKILKSDMLTEAQHFFTTRESVITSRDMPELQRQCSENLNDIAQYLNTPVENIVSPVQTHSANIAIAKQGESYPDTDALVITGSDIAVVLNFADCTPVILYDSHNNIGAVCHAGWRGTAQSIVPKTIDFMHKEFSSQPENITAIIGPAIGLKNYQVGEEVFKEVKKTMLKDYLDYYTFDETMKKYNICLKTANYHQLEELGVLRIDKCNYCTYDSVDVFFSYRRENGKTARHSAVLKLIKD